MAIRFACPSCRQPIEVDDNWAGQSVACPYCRNVVTAPSSSTWPGAEVPMANPAGGAFAAPPPPRDAVWQAAPYSSERPSVLGGWALVAAAATVALGCIA